MALQSSYFWMIGMRKPVILLLFLIITRSLFAQGTEKNMSFVLVPYLPEFYLSDAEKDIMSQSNKDPDVYRAYFRRVLDLKIQAELEGLGPCHSMLQDTTAAGSKNLELFYEKVAYSYAYPLTPRKEADKGKSKKNKTKTGNFSPQTSSKYDMSGGDVKFMMAEVRDTAFLSSISSITQSNLFICINQFEFKTNYNSCIDIGNNIHLRELLIHYSIFNNEGKVLRGNYLAESFPSNASRDTEISERIFPLIAASLKAEVEDIQLKFLSP